MPTSAARAARRAPAPTSSISQPPIDEPTSTTGPATTAPRSAPAPPRASGSACPRRIAPARAAARIVEQQALAALRLAPSRTARSPCCRPCRTCSRAGTPAPGPPPAHGGRRSGDRSPSWYCNLPCSRSHGHGVGRDVNRALPQSPRDRTRRDWAASPPRRASPMSAREPPAAIALAALDRRTLLKRRRARARAGRRAAGRANSARLHPRGRERRAGGRIPCCCGPAMPARARRGCASKCPKAPISRKCVAGGQRHRLARARLLRQGGRRAGSRRARWYHYRFIAPDGTMLGGRPHAHAARRADRPLPHGGVQLLEPRLRLFQRLCSRRRRHDDVRAGGAPRRLPLRVRGAATIRSRQAARRRARSPSRLNELVPLADYRLRYAQLSRAIPICCGCTSSIPMIAVCDDHETANDCVERRGREPPARQPKGRGRAQARGDARAYANGCRSATSPGRATTSATSRRSSGSRPA